MTDELRLERVIDASPDVVFETFLTDDGQAAFYGQDDPGWVLESDCDMRVGGVWNDHTRPLAQPPLPPPTHLQGD